MKVDELEKYLTEGLSEEEAAPIRAALKNQKVQSRAEALRQQRELDAIEATRQELQTKLDGTKDKPGASAYQQWYEKNFGQITKMSEQIAAYDAKHGAGAFEKAAAGQDPVVNTPPPSGKTYTDEDIQRIVDSRFQTQFVPNVTGVLKGTARIVQQHMSRGRKTDIDFDALDKIMGEQKLSLEKAYEEWDKPEREKEQKASTDAEVERRVKEELQKRGASASFPAGADSTPGALAVRTDKGTSRSDLIASLARDFNSAGEKVN